MEKLFIYKKILKIKIVYDKKILERINEDSINYFFELINDCVNDIEFSNFTLDITSITSAIFNFDDFSKILEDLNKKINLILANFRFYNYNNNKLIFYDQKNGNIMYGRTNLSGLWDLKRYNKELKARHNYCFKNTFNTPSILRLKSYIRKYMQSDNYDKPTLRITKNKILEEILNNDKKMETMLALVKKIYISYENDVGIDAGGLSRRFYTDLSNELLGNSSNKIKYFKIIDDKCNYFNINPDTENKHWEIIGKIFAITIIRNQNINIELDPLLILFLINDFEIVDDCKKIIKQLENYDKDIFNENCTLYSKLKNLCKIKNSEWTKKFKNVRNNLKELNKIDENDSNISYDKQIELLNDRKIITNMSEVSEKVEKKIDQNYVGFNEEKPKINDISDDKTNDEINNELNDKITKWENNKNKFNKRTICCFSRRNIYSLSIKRTKN